MKPLATINGEIDENDREEDDVVVKPSLSIEILKTLEIWRRAEHRRGTDFNMQHEHE